MCWKLVPQCGDVEEVKLLKDGPTIMMTSTMKLSSESSRY
jgi:hypothetical protein